METQEIKNNIIRCIEDYYNENNVSFNKADEEDFHLFLIDYFEVLRKMIAPRKRTVHISRELKAKVKNSTFKEWRGRFDEIKNMLENGDDINPLLSKKAKVSGFKDKLLTCWDIHHIHFYPEKKSGDMLIFALVKEDSVYLIDIIPHNKKFVFSTLELLNILHRNWKFLIEDRRTKGVINLSPVIETDEQINELRRICLNTVIKIEDDFYALDTMSADGHNSCDVMYANQIINSIRFIDDKGILGKMEFVDFALTGKMKPCFILTYKDERKNLFPLAM